jgi:hypothetical protein
MSAPNKCLSVLVRLFSALVALIGAALLAYAVFFCIKAKGFGVPAGVALGLGLVDAVMGAALTTCGYKAVCALRTFLLVNGLLALAELVVAILFIVPQTQSSIIADAALQPDVLAWVQANISIVGDILIAAVAVKLVAVILVALQSCALARGFDDSAYDTLGAAPLVSATGAEVEAAAYGRYADKNKSVRTCRRRGLRRAAAQAAPSFHAPPCLPLRSRLCTQVYEKYGLSRDGFRR